VQDDAEEGGVDLQAAVVLNEPEVPERVSEEDRRRLNDKQLGTARLRFDCDNVHCYGALWPRSIITAVGA
jgi:hypothetical protein